MVHDKSALSKEIAAMVRRLPPLPENVDALLDLATAEVVDEKAILELIAHDPALSTVLLSMASSPCFGGRGTVECMAEALERVGIAALSAQIGADSASHALAEACVSETMLRKHLAHAREVSLAARALAEAADMSARDQAFCRSVGMIHDIGRLVIACASSRVCADLLGTPWQRFREQVEEETIVLGLNHCDVGEELCAKWRIGDRLQEGVKRHHTPIQGPFSQPGALVFLAHLVPVGDLNGEIVSDLVPEEVLIGLGLDGASFDRAQQLFEETRLAGTRA